MYPNPESNREMSTLIIRNKSEILYLPLEQILYIQADGNYCNIYLADGSVLGTLTYQRAEIARMMQEQLSKDDWKQFVLLGRSYLINTKYILRIQPSKQILTFRVNQFGTIQKIHLRATKIALNQLIANMHDACSP